MSKAAVAETIEFDMPAAPQSRVPAVAKPRRAAAPATIEQAIPRAGVDLMRMVETAVQAGNLELVDKMLTLQERWEQNEARKAFNIAFGEAKAEIKPIAKNREVKFPAKNTGSADVAYQHEDLAGIANEIDEILSAHGLSYRWRTVNDFESGKVSVTCIVSHRLGHAEENTLTSKIDPSGSKNHLQAIGSAVTYLERYTLKAALGLAVKHDDDGRAAGPALDESGAPVATGPTITQEQADEITTLVKDTGGDIKRFLGWVKSKSPGVSVVTDIPADRRQDCLDKINSAAVARTKEK